MSEKAKLGGFKSSEFWFGFVLAFGIWWLIYVDKYPAYGSPGYDGVTNLMIIWSVYAGARSVVKSINGKNEKTNGHSSCNPTP